MPGGLPGKSGWDMNWRSSGTGKTLQIVQVEETYLPQAHLEPARCCSSDEQLAFKEAQHAKGGAFQSAAAFSCVHGSCSSVSIIKSTK